ncbi:MAG: anthranilate synthase component II [Flavobacteriales bacterium]
MSVLLLDNFDSFTFNLFHLLEAVGFDEIDVIRNNALELGGLKNYSLIVLSPGPGLPSEAGCMMQVIDYATKHSVPLLGICLGHQGIAEYFGMKLKNLPQVYHGRQHIAKVLHEGYFFANLPPTLSIGRYHSWTVDLDSFNHQQFELLMTDCNGEILAMQHKNLPISGLQFHPESVLTPQGRLMVENFYRNTLSKKAVPK